MASLGWASCRFFSFIVFFSWLALWFLELYRSFTMYELGGGGVSMFNETAHSVFVRERLLPCRIAVGSVGCIVYTDYVYPAFVALLADISCLLSSFLSEILGFCLLFLFFFFFFLFFPTMHSLFFIGHFVPA